MGGEFRKRGFGTTRHRFLDILDRLSFGKIFLLWVLMIVVFGLVFFILSLDEGNALLYQGKVIDKSIKGIFDSVYYSFITATTTGYGDITPQGLSRLFAIIEVLFGVIVSGIILSKLVSVKQEVILEEIYNISYEEVVDRLKNGLYLFRSDVNRTLEKIELGTIKKREVKDLWILFSGLDNSLTNIRNFMIPPKTDSLYSKKLDTLKLELLLNSIKLSMKKINEFIKSVKSHELEWRNELLLTSIYYDIQVVNEIIDFEGKKTSDKKVIDRLNELKIIIADIEEELKPEKKEDKESLIEAGGVWVAGKEEKEQTEQQPESKAGKQELHEEKQEMVDKAPVDLVDVKQPEEIDLPSEDYKSLEEFKAKEELPEFPEHSPEAEKEGHDEQEKP